MTNRCIMIMAGGTGGHVFPALSLAALLRLHGCEVVWLGTRTGIEARGSDAAGSNSGTNFFSGPRDKQFCEILHVV